MIPTSQPRSTGKERDSETGLDYFGARYYGSNMGRWMSPDWSDAPEPVPYANFDDPQTLNLYGYVRNNPVSHADADGHCGPLCGAVIGGVVGFGASYGSQLYHAKGSFIARLAQVDTNKAIRSGIGGAIIGATGGAAAGSGLPLINQAVIVGGAGAGVGIADRAIETKSMSKATEDPKAIAIDATASALTHVAGEAGNVALKQTGNAEAIETLTRQEAAAQTANRAAKIQSRLDQHLQTQARQQAAVNGAAATTVEVAKRKVEDKKPQ